MKSRDRLAANMKRLRLESGMSQEKLAADAGLARSYVSEVERGEDHRRPTLELLDKLADALGVDPKALLEPIDPKRPEPEPLPRGPVPRAGR